MSYTEMFAVTESGDVLSHQTFSNSHRGVAMVWGELCVKYLEWERHGWLMRHDGLDDLWDLVENPDVAARVAISHRIVHATTFDNVMVRCNHFGRVAEAMRQFVRDFPGMADSHLGQQAIEFGSMWQKHGAGLIGACWNQTSVNVSPWLVWDGDDDEEEGRPYNVFADAGHWFLFEKYPELIAAKSGHIVAPTVKYAT